MMRKIIAAIVLVISLFVLGFSSYTLYSYFHSIHEAEKTVDDIKDMTKHEPVLYIDPKTGDLIDFNYLKNTKPTSNYKKILTIFK